MVSRLGKSVFYQAILLLSDMTEGIVPVICEPNEHNAAYLHSKRLFEMENAKEVCVVCQNTTAD